MVSLVSLLFMHMFLSMRLVSPERRNDWGWWGARLGYSGKVGRVTQALFLSAHCLLLFGMIRYDTGTGNAPDILLRVP